MASERIVSAEESRALREKWHRRDGPYEVSPDDTGDLVIHYEDTIVARIEDFDEHSEPLARLFASAPDDVKMLSRGVEALHAEVERFRAAFRREEDRADERAQDFDDLVVKLWRAATGDTHEVPASVEALLAAVSDLRTDNARLDNVARGALDDLARVRAELDAMRAALCSYAPRCAGCGDRLATCRGSYEGAPESYACDGCCGHGNEDGHCDPVEHAAAVRAAVAR